MAGQIQRLISKIIETRAQGNNTLRLTTRTKLILKGIHPDHFTATSPDDPDMIARVRAAGREMGVQV